MDVYKPELLIDFAPWAGEKECKCSRLDWPERFTVAVGVARALDYLHDGGHTKRPVIHRDVKSSNILSSQDCAPTLRDIGLALWAADAAAQGVGRPGLIHRCGDDDLLGIGGGRRRLKQVRIRDPFPHFLADVAMVVLPATSLVSAAECFRNRAFVAGSNE